MYVRVRLVLGLQVYIASNNSRHWVYFTWYLYKSNSLAGSAASVEVCTLLSVYRILLLFQHYRLVIYIQYRSVIVIPV